MFLLVNLDFFRFEHCWICNDVNTELKKFYDKVLVIFINANTEDISFLNIMYLTTNVLRFLTVYTNILGNSYCLSCRNGSMRCATKMHTTGGWWKCVRHVFMRAVFLCFPHITRLLNTTRFQNASFWTFNKIQQNGNTHTHTNTHAFWGWCHWSLVASR